MHQLKYRICRSATEIMNKIEQCTTENNDLYEIFQLFNCEIDGEITLPIVRQLQNWNLIYREQTLKCPNGHFYVLRANSRCKDGFYWGCTEWYKNVNRKRVRCSATLSLRTYTFFEKSQLSLYKLVAFSYLWLKSVTLNFLIIQLEISRKTGVYWASFHREVLIYAAKEDDRIGGPDTVVEIDEAAIGRRIDYRGNWTEGQWIFGGVERGTSGCFLVAVETRSIEGFLQLIEQHIRPNTTIVSDCWETYDCLNDDRFKRLTANYSIEFKDPLADTNSNTIEKLWQHLEDSLPERRRSKNFFREYLAKFVFKRKCRISKLDTLSEFFKIANKLYNNTKLLNLDSSSDSDIF